MWIPDSSVKTLVDNICDIIKNKPHLISDVRQELEELKTQLEKLRLLMPNFFHSDDNYGLLHHSRTASGITEILDGAEDSVDYVYSFCSGRRSPVNRMFLTDTKSRRNQISRAKRRIQEAGIRVKCFNKIITENGYHDQVLHNRDQAILNLDPTLSAHKVGEERVIGFDEAVAEVVGIITTGAEKLKVISIVGMVPGMGKTTLARMVCNDDEVQSQYKIRAFVHLSTNFDKKKVLLKILNSFAQGDDELAKNSDGYSLEKYVRKQLKDKPYLIVLDNVLEEWDWYRLKDAFPNNRDERCRVVIINGSANMIGNPEYVYRMKFLSLESSKELLRWWVFGENNCPKELQEYEEDLAIKCHGLPLALLSIAAVIMKHQDRVEWWKAVANNTVENYWASNLELYPAYAHLPNHLKPCFLYFAVFGPEVEIPIAKLLRLWISEGFIQEEEAGSRSLEDIAEQYLQVLVDRHFVMVSKRRSNGRMGMCKMNATFHEFCTIQAAKEEIIMNIKHINHFKGSVLGKCRRIGINANILNGLSDHPTAGKDICSLLRFSQSEIELDTRTTSFIPKRFKLLKVFEAGFLYDTLPNQFWSLVLLKYLAISGETETLPSTLSDLWNLQTLIVNTTSPTLEIKADIWKMPHFRHLHTNASATFPCKRHKIEDGAVTNLRTLCYISPECCRKELFHWTVKLRKLGISGTLAEANGGEFTLLDHLHKLEYLENLKLLNCNNSPGLPPKISFPKQLTKLTLSNTRLDWKEMRTLGEMEQLEVLKLKEYAFVGKQWKTENGGFLRLKHLHIGRMDLIVWEALADHFPQLKSLEISGCNQLRRIPHSLADIQSLQSVHLHSSTSPGVTYSLKRIRLVKFLQTKGKTFDISIFLQRE